MRCAPYDPSTSAAWADALFASALQRSDEPSATQVKQAVAAAMDAFGGIGCVARVAQAYGSGLAVEDMAWGPVPNASVWGLGRIRSAVAVVP